MNVPAQAQDAGRRPALLLIPGALLVAVLAGLARAPSGQVPLYLALLGLAFLCYSGAVVVLIRAGWRAALSLILLVTFAGSAVLIPAPARESTDAYRYLWEGRVLLHGQNPLLHAPTDPLLASLRRGNWSRINNRTVPSIYTTTSQIAFALSAAIAPGSLLFWKSLMAGTHLLVVLFLAAWLRARGDPPAQCLLYAWNPLALSETVLNAHQDAIGIAFLCASFWLAETALRKGTSLARSAGSGALLCAAVFARSYALLAAPFLLLRSPRKAAWIGGFVAALLCLAPPLYWGWPSSGASPPWTGMHTFALRWERNDSLFRVLKALAAVLAPGSAGAARAASLLLLSVIATALVFAAWKWPEVDAADGALASLGALLLLSPVLYPWYLLTLLPLAAVRRRWSVLVFSVLVSLDYLHPFFGEERAWVLLLEYLPLAVALAAEFWPRASWLRRCAR